MKTINVLISIFLTSLICFYSNCSEESTDPGNGNNDLIVLEEIDDVLPNPFKGFAPWVGVQNPIFETRLQYKTYEWRDIEPQKGVYNWTLFEQGWGNIAVNERRVGFRISAATPGSSNQIDIPDWLVAEGIQMRQYEIDGQTGLAPDWDDPNFLQAHNDLIMALGARYDNDPRIAWIDIGSYGFWGEWHVWLNDSLVATQATKQTILEHYFSAFPTKHKVIAFDDDFATKYVTDRGGGIRNDCLGTQNSNNWYLESLNRIDPTLNERVWKNAIITGEFCGSSQGAIEGTTTRFDLNYSFIKQTHWSYIGTAGGAIPPQNDEHRKNLEILHKTLGYRFVLIQISHEQTVSQASNVAITVKVENKGVAPFYYQWPLVAYLVSSDTVILEQELGIDIRNWMPGINTVSANLQLPQNISTGSYDLKLAILDPVTHKPEVMFANTRRDSEGRYLVSKFNVQ